MKIQSAVLSDKKVRLFIFRDADDFSQFTESFRNCSSMIKKLMPDNLEIGNNLEEIIKVIIDRAYESLKSDDGNIISYIEDSEADAVLKSFSLVLICMSIITENQNGMIDSLHSAFTATVNDVNSMMRLVSDFTGNVGDAFNDKDTKDMAENLQKSTTELSEQADSLNSMISSYLS